MAALAIGSCNPNPPPRVIAVLSWGFGGLWDQRSRRCRGAALLGARRGSSTRFRRAFRSCRGERPSPRGDGLSGVNYFFALTTTISPGQRQLLLALRAARSAAARPL